MTRRVVITGIGLVSPLGNSASQLWDALAQEKTGIAELTSIPTASLPTPFGAEAREFTGSIEEFGPLEKTLSRNIKKNLRVMCREIQMGVAVAQLCINDAGLKLDSIDRDRLGVLYGSDYMLTLPGEFALGVRKCLDAQGHFDFTKWADEGLPAVEPLWLLKYLPNLPAAHVAIFNELRGPNNSLTSREASSNLAVFEAYHTIVRGHADRMLAGATGTRIHPARSVHVAMQETLAEGSDPATLSRPFDRARTGQVLGEGAACILLEELASAEARGAKIIGEIIGGGSSIVASRQSEPDEKTAIANVLKQSLQSAKLKPAEVGHIHAHGLSDVRLDRLESQGIAAALGADKDRVPVTAAKSYFGNLGAASGLIEAIASTLALENGSLFPIQSLTELDPECPIRPAKKGDRAGSTCINLSVTPQGQASGIVIRRWAS
ncbi:3-oxoacyl-[acyl-carrier-protein] synthase 2 [Anatilimnocola aggregata]|uniref:3-oxoacyl-[acyl-carrier-protein] synthase 2 n=1 Tax=Anatilimnocola aggregata TaxID=2528021 RepID=A0A517YEG2_9BACT|nr:beta-ketoacyl synthase N-terminal-like domain-containing protein [Anatilimnocola aggregata]QDU28616.1 3-oxoacyl-[acyl-carrier-protein] synthase 2 [Anatilimnocola aggregata]